MNHKRKRPKHQRSGCLMCKPHKDEREKKEPKASDKRRMQPDEDATWEACAWCQHARGAHRPGQCYGQFLAEWGGASYECSCTAFRPYAKR
jgi:hypothetical protein